MKSVLKPKNFANFKRLRFYLVSFVVILTLLTTLTNFWKSLDFLVYKSFYLDNSEEIKIRPDIQIIDLPYVAEGRDKHNLENFRARLSNLLFTIDSISATGDKPRAVLLDIYFSEEKESDSIGLKDLENKITSLQDKSVEVYGVYNMDFDDNRSFESHDKNQARNIYEVLTGFRLHSIINEEWGVFGYKSVIKMRKESGGYELIDALPISAASDLSPSTYNPSIDDERIYILPLGDSKNIDSQAYEFKHSQNKTTAGRFSESFELDDQILIIGSFDGDETTPDKGAPQIGTKLLAWALNDQLENNILAKKPLDKLGVVLGIILFFSFFVVLIFGAIYKYIKSLQTKPVIISTVSFIIGVICLILFGFAYLASNVVIPIGLPILSMFVSSLLVLHFSKKFLVAGITEGSGKYDVFISYSHGDSDWVKANIYTPLSEFKRKDGSSLNIFFDVKSIGIGEAFTIKYMKAIVDSKVFLPIMSEEYYNKNHCRNEMDLAVKRNVEQLMELFPIAFSFDCIPEHYTHINAVVISEKKNFIEVLKDRLENV